MQSSGRKKAGTEQVLIRKMIGLNYTGDNRK